MGTEIEVVLNVGANALIDQCAEFRVVQGCAVLFDQAVEFVENEVFGVDAVVNARKNGCCFLGALHQGAGLFGTRHGSDQARLNRISARIGSMSSIVTWTMLPGSSVPGSGSLPRK